VVEDCGMKWLDGIRTYFGDRVADGVVGCSDCAPADGEAKAPWRDRKETYLRHLETASPDVLIVSACDKLHNAGAIVSDLEDIGVAVFSRFTAGQEGTLWYYESLARVFGRRLRGSHPRLAARLSDMVSRMKALSEKDTRAFV
jgi:GTP pyrophosphokinase